MSCFSVGRHMEAALAIRDAHQSAYSGLRDFNSPKEGGRHFPEKE